MLQSYYKTQEQNLHPRVFTGIHICICVRARTHTPHLSAEGHNYKFSLTYFLVTDQKKTRRGNPNKTYADGPYLPPEC